MIRAICYWCSVRSELGQHRICRDIFKVVIDPHKPDADLYYFYDEWMKVYLELYGVRPPSDEMRASIHAHFLEQCRKPSKLEQVMGFYDMSDDEVGTGMKTYEWLIGQIERLMLMEKEEFNIGRHESTLNQRGRGWGGSPPGTAGGDARTTNWSLEDRLAQIDAAFPEDSDDSDDGLAAPLDPWGEQTDAAVDDPANSGRSRRGRGKGRKKICYAFRDTGECSRGAECWYAASTPGHP